MVWGVLSLYSERVLQAIILNAPHPIAMAKALMSNPKQLQKSWYIGERGHCSEAILRPPCSGKEVILDLALLNLRVNP